MGAIQTTDEELISRIAQQEREAFVMFYERHASLALGLIVRLVRVREDADEALQDVFLQVWRDSSSYDPERARPVSWLLMIARSRAMDRRRRREYAGEDAIELDELVAGDREDVVVRDEEGSRVRAAVAALPENQAECIRMSFFDGLTHYQIAERTSTPLGTVKARIRSGMVRLKTTVGSTG